MDAQLRALIDLQVVDSRIAGLEAQVAKIPAQIAAIHAAVDEARKAMDGLKARVDVSRKSQRAREKDLEDNRVKRQKYEGQLYQVKTNKEYSAVLVEIEEVKQEKSRIEEDILGLMESQERIAAELKDAEGGLEGSARARARARRPPSWSGSAASRPSWPWSGVSGSTWLVSSSPGCSTTTTGSCGIGASPSPR